jgi:hypothetical protein
MRIISCGHVPSVKTTEELLNTFCDHITLLLKNQQRILDRSETFFIELPFAWCSWPYIGGDGPLYLGYLLLGWQIGRLTAKCPKCSGTLRIYSFGGSPLSGINGATGACLECNATHFVRRSDEDFRRSWRFVFKLRKRFPQNTAEQNIAEARVFSWGGDGFVTKDRKETVRKQVTTPIVFETLLALLQSENQIG